MKVLITGSEGNIGSDGFINYFKKIFNGTIYLTDIKGKRKNNFFKVDLTDEKQLKKLPKNIDIVVHMASIGLPTKIQNIYRVNFFSTLNLLHYYKNTNLKNFIFFSSVCVYGLPNTGVLPDYVPVDEKHPEKTVDHYGMSKSVVEKLLYHYSKISNFSIIVLRLGSVITKTKNTYEFRMDLIKNDKNYREGGELWNFVDYRDLARGIKTIIEKETGKFDIFNFTSDNHLMKEKNSVLLKYLRKKIEIKDKKFPESKKSFFDNSKFKNYFKFKFLFSSPF